MSENAMLYVKVLVDPQIDFVSGVFGTAEARAVAGCWARFLAPATAAECRADGASGRLYMITRDSHPAPYCEAPESRIFATPHCVAGTEGAAFVAPVDEAVRAQAGNPAYRVCEKNGFTCVDLPEAIIGAAEDCSFACSPDGKGMKIVLCGVVTDICVLANALYLQARLPWADVAVDVAGCAGVTPQSHEKALEIMATLGIKIME